MSRKPRHPLIGPDEPQLSLFDAIERDPTDDAGQADAEQDQARLQAIRNRLPAGLRFGTSSWTFPGWAGLVYRRRYPSQKAFLRESLCEYAAHPLMRTVGVDRGYYAPIPTEDLASYAAQLPADFRCAVKVWQQIAMPIYPQHPRYGADAGKPNPSFLDVELFERELGAPFRQTFASAMGPWILEVAPTPRPIDPSWFCQRLGEFLHHAPRDFPFAIELRDRRLLVPEYVRVLREHGAVHVFNYWSRMPGLGEQMRREGLLHGSLLVVRLLLPPGGRYSDLKEAYAPFDRLVAPQPAMRRELVELVERGLGEGMEAYVLVNNKAEGSSPLTVRALAELLAR